MEKQENKISARLNAIADALETASKQARLLAAEIESTATINLNPDKLAQDIAKAMHDSARVNLQLLHAMPQESEQ